MVGGVKDAVLLSFWVACRIDGIVAYGIADDRTGKREKELGCSVCSLYYW